MLILILSLTLIALIATSGFFSGSETGVISCSSIKVRNLASEGDKKAIKLQSLLSDKQKVIILILVLNNIVNTTYTIAGETLLQELAGFFSGSAARVSLGVLITTAILTPPLVALGEILPKTLFRHYSFSLTRMVAPLLYRLKWLCSPLLAPLSLFSTSGSRRRMDLLSYSKDSLNLLLESGTESGKIMGTQEKIIKHVLNLSNITLEDIHQPLDNIEFLNSNMRGKQAIQFISEKKITAPYFIQRKGKYIGYITLKTLWAMNENEKIENHLQGLPKLSARESGLKGLNHLLLTKTSFALVTREKQITGFISLREILTPHF